VTAVESLQHYCNLPLLLDLILEATSNTRSTLKTIPQLLPDQRYVIHLTMTNGEVFSVLQNPLRQAWEEVGVNLFVWDS
jgi:hypothetical protein